MAVQLPATHYFPARPLKRTIQIDGAWYVSHKAEQIKNISKSRNKEKIKNILIDKPDVANTSIVDKNCLDGFFLMRHCKVDDPSHISHVNISDCNLIEAKTADFHFFDSVVHINAAENLLTIENFNGFTNLKELELPLNGISKISLTADMLPHLEYLDVSFNELSPNDLLNIGLLQNLKRLHISGNGFVTLPPDLVMPEIVDDGTVHHRFRKLEFLMLDDNLLSKDEIFALLAGLSKLKVLSLERNRFKKIPFLRNISGQLEFSVSPSHTTKTKTPRSKIRSNISTSRSTGRKSKELVEESNSKQTNDLIGDANFVKDLSKQNFIIDGTAFHINKAKDDEVTVVKAINDHINEISERKLEVDNTKNLVVDVMSHEITSYDNELNQAKSKSGAATVNENEVDQAKYGAVINENEVDHSKSGAAINENKIGQQAMSSVARLDENTVDQTKSGVDPNENEEAQAKSGAALDENTVDQTKSGAVINENELDQQTMSSAALDENTVDQTKSGVALKENEVDHTMSGAAINENELDQTKSDAPINESEVDQTKSGGAINENELDERKSSAANNDNKVDEIQPSAANDKNQVDETESGATKTENQLEESKSSAANNKENKLDETKSTTNGDEINKTKSISVAENKNEERQTTSSASNNEHQQVYGVANSEKALKVTQSNTVITDNQIYETKTHTENNKDIVVDSSHIGKTKDNENLVTTLVAHETTTENQKKTSTHSVATTKLNAEVEQLHNDLLLLNRPESAPVVEIMRNANLTDLENILEQRLSDRFSSEPMPFPSLRSLNLGHNMINKEEDVVAVAAWPMLSELLLHENPLTTKKSGAPPLLTSVLTQRLGVQLYKRKPELRSRPPPPQVRRKKHHRNINTRIPPIPKVDVDQLLLSIKAPTEVQETTKINDETLEEHSKDSYWGSEDGDEPPVFLTALADEVGEACSRENGATSTLAGVDKQEIVNEEVNKRSFTEYTGYELLFVDDSDVEDMPLPKDVVSSVKALEYMLDHPITVDAQRPPVYQSHPQYREHRMKDTMPPIKPRQTKNELVKKTIDNTKKSQPILEIPLSDVIAKNKSLPVQANQHGKVRKAEAEKLLQTIQKRYHNVRDKSLQDAKTQSKEKLIGMLDEIKTEIHESLAKTYPE